MKQPAMIAWLLFSVVLGSVNFGCSSGNDDLPDGGCVWVHLPGGASFCGGPSYISEFQTDYRDNGGPLSDFASHCGVKASVEDLDFGGLRHFASVTGENVLDYSRTGLVGVSAVGLAGEDRDYLLPAEKREVRFDYWGWREKALDAGLKALSNTCFVSQNVYLTEVSISNGGAADHRFSPKLAFRNKAATAKVHFDPAHQVVVVEAIVAASLGVGKNFYAMAPCFRVDRFEVEPSTQDFSLTGEALALAPGQDSTFCLVTGYSPDSEKEAIQLAREAADMFREDPSVPYEAARQRWQDFFLSLPSPHTNDPRFVELYRLAATALKMNLYGPRNEMRGHGAVPSKVHYGWFWLWDVGLQALGYSEIDPAIAEETAGVMFSSMTKRGFMAHMTNDLEMTMTPHSQSPVFGWTLPQVVDRDGNEGRARDFMREMYGKSVQFIQWWDRKRDRDGNGLYEFLSMDEAGWDNSPRRDFCGPSPSIPYVGRVCEVVSFLTNPVNDVDASTWLYQYFEAMAGWAGELGLPDEQEKWKQRAGELGKRIDEILWKDDLGAWFDARRNPEGPGYTHWTVLTPVIWFPAFAGSSTDREKVRRVIEEHILNPDEFFGTYPIPSVAYNDPFFDRQTPGWTGYVWLVTLYTALSTLYQYGYEDEALELRKRTLEMMAEQGAMKGIYETYDPLTGSYKNEYSTGSYCAFQFGWSSSMTMEILLDRYQSKRYVFADTREIEGYVQRAVSWIDRNTFFEVNRRGGKTPFVHLESSDGRPLLESRAISVEMRSPDGEAEGEVTFSIGGTAHTVRVPSAVPFLCRMD